MDPKKLAQFVNPPTSIDDDDAPDDEFEEPAEDEGVDDELVELLKQHAPEIAEEAKMITGDFAEPTEDMIRQASDLLGKLPPELQESLVAVSKGIESPEEADELADELVAEGALQPQDLGPFSDFLSLVAFTDQVAGDDLAAEEDLDAEGPPADLPDPGAEV